MLWLQSRDKWWAITSPGRSKSKSSSSSSDSIGVDASKGSSMTITAGASRCGSSSTSGDSSFMKRGDGRICWAHIGTSGLHGTRGGWLNWAIEVWDDGVGWRVSGGHRLHERLRDADMSGKEFKETLGGGGGGGGGLGHWCGTAALWCGTDLALMCHSLENSFSNLCAHSAHTFHISPARRHRHWAFGSYWPCSWTGIFTAYTWTFFYTRHNAGQFRKLTKKDLVHTPKLRVSGPSLWIGIRSCQISGPPTWSTALDHGKAKPFSGLNFVQPTDCFPHFLENIRCHKLSLARVISDCAHLKLVVDKRNFVGVFLQKSYA